MTVYTLGEVEDKYIGKVGTPHRDEYERKIAADIEAYKVGEALKQARLAKNLTQEEVGERMGVTRGQVCRLEGGRSITLASMMRAFRAMGVEVSLVMKGVGSVAL